MPSTRLESLSSSAGYPATWASLAMSEPTQRRGALPQCPALGDYPYQRGIFILPSDPMCCPNGSDRGTLWPGTNSGSSSPIWSPGSQARAGADAKKSFFAGYVWVTRTAHMDTCFEGRRGRCALDVTHLLQSRTYCWHAGITPESAEFISDAFPQRSHSNTSLETTRPGFRTAAFSPSSVTSTFQ